MKKFINHIRAYLPPVYRQGIVQTTNAQRVCSKYLNVLMGRNSYVIGQKIDLLRASIRDHGKNPSLFNKLSVVYHGFDMVSSVSQILAEADETTRYYDFFDESLGWRTYHVKSACSQIVSMILRETSKDHVNFLFYDDDNSICVYECSHMGATIRWAEDLSLNLNGRPTNKIGKSIPDPGNHCVFEVAFLDYENCFSDLLKHLNEKYRHQHSFLTLLRDGSLRALLNKQDVSYSKAKPSEFSQTLRRKVDMFQQEGLHRSFMLYGPPGTGKTTATLEATKDKYTVRLNASDLNELSQEDWEYIVDFLKPEVIIIDDIDRARLSGNSLNMLEIVNAKVPFFIATANYIYRMDPAFLRPGRFDEFIEIDSPDRDLVLQVLNGNEKHYDLVKDWPIAWVHDFAKRVRCYGEERAMNDVKDLMERLESIENRHGISYREENSRSSSDDDCPEFADDD